MGTTLRDRPLSPLVGSETSSKGLTSTFSRSITNPQCPVLPSSIAQQCPPSSTTPIYLYYPPSISAPHSGLLYHTYIMPAHMAHQSCTNKTGPCSDPALWLTSADRSVVTPGSQRLCHPLACYAFGALEHIAVLTGEVDAGPDPNRQNGGSRLMLAPVRMANGTESEAASGELGLGISAGAGQNQTPSLGHTSSSFLRTFVSLSLIVREPCTPKAEQMQFHAKLLPNLVH